MPNYGGYVGLSRAQETADVARQQQTYERQIAALEKKKADQDRKANKWGVKYGSLALGAVAGGAATYFTGSPVAGAAAFQAGRGVGDFVAGAYTGDRTATNQGIDQAQQALAALAANYEAAQGLKPRQMVTTSHKTGSNTGADMSGMYLAGELEDDGGPRIIRVPDVGYNAEVFPGKLIEG